MSFPLPHGTSIHSEIFPLGVSSASLIISRLASLLSLTTVSTTELFGLIRLCPDAFCDSNFHACTVTGDVLIFSTVVFPTSCFPEGQKVESNQWRFQTKASPPHSCKTTLYEWSKNGPQNGTVFQYRPRKT